MYNSFRERAVTSKGDSADTKGTDMMDGRSAGLLLLCLVLCYGTAAVGGLFTASSVKSWYMELAKPRWNPPAWVFGPVWTLLYGLMAGSLWLVWKRHGFAGAARPAIVLFLVHLVLNGAWSGLFFGLRSPGWALVEIAFLWASILALVLLFRPLSVTASWMLVPYLLWVSFASVLNGAIFWLNR